MKYHPDRNPDDKDAEEKFKEASEAHEVLRRKQTRRLRPIRACGPEGAGGMGGGFSGGGFSDIFGDVFGDIFGGGGGGRRAVPRVV